MHYINVDHHHIDLVDRLVYTLDFINNHPLVKGKIYFTTDGTKDVHGRISYGIAKEASWYIPAQNTLYSSGNIDCSLLHANGYIIDDLELYSVESVIKTKGLFEENGQIGFDIFETIFFHISRYEEVHSTNKDLSVSGWLEEELHFLVRHKLEKKPVVDELISTLVQVLTGEKIMQKSTMSLSHDIDVLYRFSPWYKMPRSILAIAYHRRGLAHFFKSIRLMLGFLFTNKRDPYDVYSWLLTHNQAFTNKVIYFMSGGETSYDNLYAIEHPLIEQLAKQAQQKSYQLGLHPSYNAGLDTDMLSEEKKKLSDTVDKEIHWNRQHCLRWSWPTTPDIITHLGFGYDSSMGYNRRIGYRCGTGFMYRMYDFNYEKPYDWHELPLVYMESSLIHESKRSSLSLSQITTDFIEDNKNNTHIEMNWHNSNFDSSMWYGDELKNIYLRLIKNV